MQLDFLLLDIEGTTTPISFVYDVLFPYARQNVRAFLERRFDEPAVVADRRAIGLEEAIDPDDLDEVVAAVWRQMDADRKSTGLKSLQGKIWKDGYGDGLLTGLVYDDVPEVLRACDASLRVGIYSSGSVAAQKLLFRHTNFGDLTPYLSAYFDTTTGPKKEAESYRAITNALGAEPAAVLFCTDNLDEAVAADVAGVRAVLLARPGNPALPAHDLDVWDDLTPVHEFLT